MSDDSREKWPPGWAWWVTTGMAFFALALSGVNILFPQFPAFNRLRFTPILANELMYSENVVSLEFALANAGTTATILGEICLLPRPWGDEVYRLPENYVGRIPSSTGVAWRSSPDGAARESLLVGPGELIRERVFFDLTPYTHSEWFNSESDIRVDLYTTVLDHYGGIHVTKLADWLALSNGGLRWQRSQSTELLPGLVRPEGGGFWNPQIGVNCIFIGPVFGPVDESANQSAAQ